VVTDNMHDRVELNHISHQSGHGGGHATGISVSYLNYEGRGRTGFCDKPVAVDGQDTCNMPRQIISAGDWTDCAPHHKKLDLL